tara:strand:- start:48337 stop:48906 length:570 start_codon:yes stop_codon:yes gene_type:complete
MLKIKLSKEDCDKLIALSAQKNVWIEGNLLKLLDDSISPEWKDYLETSSEKFKEKQVKRVSIYKDLQVQVKEYRQKNKENQLLLEEVKGAHREAEGAKKSALDDLDVLQKRKQTELTSRIVRYALYIIAGVGIVTTLMYILAILTDKETQIIGSTWSNLTGILLTNAFSIVGTIMGVKHLNNDSPKKEN